MDKKEKTAIIDVGGGMKGIYSAGVLDRLIDDDIVFDICIGVSAGSGNLASYAAGQRGRNRNFYEKYPHSREYMSLSNFAKKHSYFDFDYIYGDLTNMDGTDPIDLRAMTRSSSRLYVVATNLLTGRAAYFDERFVSVNQYDVFKASCAIPILCRPIRFCGLEYCDGTISDPVPVKKAFELGADKVVLILSSPPEKIADSGSRKRKTMNYMLQKSSFGKKYPMGLKALKERPEIYNKSILQALEYEKQGRLLIVYPGELHGVAALSKNPDRLDLLYQDGYRDAGQIAAFLNNDSGGIRKENTAGDQGHSDQKNRSYSRIKTGFKTPVLSFRQDSLHTNDRKENRFMAHYYTSEAPENARDYLIQFELGGKNFEMQSSDGIFSKDRLDTGTRILLETLITQKPQNNVLDLGCGSGVIGVVLSKFWQAHITGIDVNSRACDLAGENYLHNQVDGEVRNQSDLSKTGMFDCIVLNPPIRAGKSVIYDLFEQSYQHLEPDGILYIVIRKQHGAQSALNFLEKTGFECSLLNREKGFWVIKAEKPASDTK